MFPYINFFGLFRIPMFGIMLVIALNVYLYCVINHKGREKILSEDQLLDLFFYAVIGGLAGGRLLYLYQHDFSGITAWYDFFKLWDGGLAILGAISGAIVTIITYTYIQGISTLRVLDVATVYAPLVQSIARWGCFFNGCCHGGVCSSSTVLALTYTHKDSVAPLHTPLYPTQIYMSIVALGIFFLLYFINSRRSEDEKANEPGFIFGLYITLISCSRFFIDFFRGDRDIVTSEFFREMGSSVSFYQQIALITAGVGIVIILINISYRAYRRALKAMNKS